MLESMGQQIASFLEGGKRTGMGVRGGSVKESSGARGKNPAGKKKLGGFLRGHCERMDPQAKSVKTRQSRGKCCSKAKGGRT